MINSSGELELEQLLKTLTQKVKREREARIELDGAELAYLTDYNAPPEKVEQLRATLRAATRRVKHDSYITDAAVQDAEAFLKSKEIAA